MKMEIKLVIIMICAISLATIGPITIYSTIMKNETNTDAIIVEGKLAVIVKKDGVFDDINIKYQLDEFLISVKNDIDLDNVGVQYFNGDSIDDLDSFIESLYYHDDVRYAIMVGRNLAWENQDGWKTIDDTVQGAFWHINDKLYFLEAREPDNRGKPHGSPEIKDIAISWIIEPDICYPHKPQNEIDEIKKEIILNIISTYTSYHNNPDETLNSYKKSRS
jgi:hypothetical protein